MNQVMHVYCAIAQRQADKQTARFQEGYHQQGHDSAHEVQSKLIKVSIRTPRIVLQNARCHQSKQIISTCSLPCSSGGLRQCCCAILCLTKEPAVESLKYIVLKIWFCLVDHVKRKLVCQPSLSAALMPACQQAVYMASSVSSHVVGAL